MQTINKPQSKVPSPKSLPKFKSPTRPLKSHLAHSLQEGGGCHSNQGDNQDGHSRTERKLSNPTHHSGSAMAVGYKVWKKVHHNKSMYMMLEASSSMDCGNNADDEGEEIGLGR